MDKKSRGKILRICRLSPAGVTVEYLSNVLRKAGEDLVLQNIEENLAYLTDRRYLLREPLLDRLSGVHRVRYRITADGIDVAQGTTEDAGVIYVD